MTDRELLELAAKAAGHKVYKNESKRGGILIFKEGRQQFLEEDGSPISLWNPLTDDGEAMRLAVNLEITVGPESPDVIGPSLCRASWNNRTMSLGEYGDGDPLYATRRAIVRAAAEIERKKQ